ncbi:MAG: dihydroorotase [Candidatus Omnitrophica bacterium]|nr:dihydroorotase [Candidatus Omnitrophota bacterium]
MMLLIKNAKIVNSDGIDDRIKDILIQDGKIVKIGENLKSDGADIIDAKGKFVSPGFIDLHAHFRQPGQEYKETIETGSAAAAKGGFTSVFCMPNTKPPIDNIALVDFIIREGKRVGLVNVYPVGAITKGQQDEELTDMFEMRRAGCLMLSDDGKSVHNSHLMRMALQYSQMVGILISEHCEDPLLSKTGVVNEGYFSTLLGMKGDPAVSETTIISRDIELAHYLDCRIHFAHVSTKRSVELIRRAKTDGVKVSAEACPHHFSLTEKEIRSFNTNLKVKPPLRSEEDVAEIKRGLKDGTIDCIATDHAPHSQEEKELDFDQAPSGMIGLETAFGLGITELVDAKILTLPQLIDKMSASPAKITGLSAKGKIAEGMDADLTVFDSEAPWQVKAAGFASKSKNSPFIGKTLKGLVLATICGGNVVYNVE